MRLLSKRHILAGVAAAIASPAGFAAESPFAPLEARLQGGRLGVYALRMGASRRLAHRADERFPMASTFKALLAGAVLARVDAGQERLDRMIPFTKADLLAYAPVAEARVGEGALSVETLCKAIVEVSDNTAANLLLKTVGGPEGLTAWLRGIGDPVTRLDRWELELNEAAPGDPRDTTTPAAMVGAWRTLLLGGVLTPRSRERLAGWLVGASTGLNRLRKDLPPGWRAGDKTGNGFRGSSNDVAILWPPPNEARRGGPILIAAYMTGTEVPMAVREGVHAEIGRIVRGALA